MSTDRLIDVLLATAQLLSGAGESRAASSLTVLAHEGAAADDLVSRQIVVRKVLALFGGMGSLQDVVLQNERGVLPEQQEFDKLCAELFEEARSELR